MTSESTEEGLISGIESGECISWGLAEKMSLVTFRFQYLEKIVAPRALVGHKPPSQDISMEMDFDFLACQNNHYSMGGSFH